MSTTKPTDAALTARIRRALAKEGSRLCISRPTVDCNSLGIYVVSDNNVVEASHCTINGLADELGLIKPEERETLGLAPEGGAA